MQFQTAQNELPLFTIKEMNQSKTNLPSVNPSLLQTAPTQYQCILHQPKINAHSNRFPIGWILWSETFILRSMPLTCHSARSRRRSRRIHQHRGIKYYLDLSFRIKTRLWVSTTSPKIDKILERTVLLKILIIFQNLGSYRFSRGAAWIMGSDKDFRMFPKNVILW